MPSIKNKTVTGIKWVAFSKYAQKICTVISFVILARLLEPKAFGLFAMAFIIIDGLNLFKNLGVDAALVQRKDDIEVASHTAFWMMPIFGTIILLVLYFFAPYGAILLKEKSLVPIIRSLGIIFLLGSMQSVPQCLLSKELNFKALEIRNLISTVCYSACAITLAYFNFGVWSLVYAYLLRRTMMMVLTWSISDYRPKFIFDRRIAIQMLHFGKYIFGASLISFLILNVDNFLVGRILGAALLGYYALAYNISDMTSTHLAQMIGAVLFPAYAKIQNDTEAIKRITLKIMKVIAMFSLPFGLTVMLLTKEIIGSVYGAKWIPAIAPLKILALCSIMLPTCGAFYSVFNACGKPKWIFYLSVTNVVLMAGTIPFFALKLGLMGVAAAVTFSKIITIPVSFVLVNKLIGLNMGVITKTLRPVLLSGMIMALSVFFVKGFVLIEGGRSMINLVNLAILLLFAGLIYFSSMYVLDKQGLVDIKDVLFNPKKVSSLAAGVENA